MDPFTRKVVGIAVIAAGVTVILGAFVAPQTVKDFGVRNVALVFLLAAGAVVLIHRLRR